MKKIIIALGIISCISVFLLFPTMQTYATNIKDDGFGLDIDQFDKNEAGQEEVTVNVLEEGVLPIFNSKNSPRYQDYQTKMQEQQEKLQQQLFINNYQEQKNEITEYMFKDAPKSALKEENHQQNNTTNGFALLIFIAGISALSIYGISLLEKRGNEE